MNCSKCGAPLPRGSFGNVKCEHCNTENYVPTPEEAREKKAEVEAAVAKRSWFGAVVAIIVIGFVLGAAFVPAISVTESYTETETYVEQEPYEETYTEQEKVETTKTVTKEVPTTTEETYIEKVPYQETVQVPYTEQEAYSVQEEISYSVTALTYDIRKKVLFLQEDKYYMYIDFEFLLDEDAGGPITVRFLLNKDGSFVADKYQEWDESKTGRGPHYIHDLEAWSIKDYNEPERYKVEYIMTVPTKTVIKYRDVTKYRTETVTVYRDVEKTQIVPDTKTITEEVPDIVYESVEKTRTAYRDVQKQRPVTRTKTVQKTLLEWALSEYG